MTTPAFRGSRATRGPQITQVLERWREGRREVFDELVPLVYSELKQIAAGCLRHERPTASLQATALVHEAYLRLAEYREPNFESRRHFYVAAAQAMRRILIDHARRRNAAKREAAPQEPPVVPALDVEVLALDVALSSLARIDAEKARIVELRYFAGLSVPEIAEITRTSPATVKRQWTVARAWLYRAISAEGAP